MLAAYIGGCTVSFIHNFVRLRLSVLLLATILVAVLFLAHPSTGLADPPPSSPTPLLAWAGQRILLEHYWGDDTGACPDFDSGAGDPNEFGILYTRESGQGYFTAELNGNPNDIDFDANNALVDVNRAAVDENFDGITDPNSACISRVVYQSEDQGLVSVTSFAVADNDTISSFTPRSQQFPFRIYYMKLEDVALTLVPGSRSGVNSGDFTPTTPPVYETSNDVTFINAAPPSDVLIRSHQRLDPHGQLPRAPAIHG